MDDNNKNIIKGDSHEKYFTEFLDNHGLPFIYVEQGPQDKYYSKIFKGNKTKRPDLLVYLPNIGHVFIDVKSRYAIEDLNNADNNKFYIRKDEIYSLFLFQSYFLLPFWIAFISTKKGDNKNFYFVPISVLKLYTDQLSEELGKNNNLLNYLFIRIPNSFLRKADDIINLISINDTYDNIMKKEAEEYKKLNDKIIEITDDLKKNNISDIQDYCKNNKIEYIKVFEVEEYLKLSSGKA